MPNRRRKECAVAPRLHALRGANARKGNRSERNMPRADPFWVGEPIDVADIALFLDSTESRMITGDHSGRWRPTSALSVY